jgi:hypothetical protein
MSDEYSVCPVCGSNSGQGCTADCTAVEITKLRTENAACGALWRKLYEELLAECKEKAAEITKLQAEVFWLRQGMSAKLSDHMNGAPCAEIRWQHEREALAQAAVAALQKDKENG